MNQRKELIYKNYTSLSSFVLISIRFRQRRFSNRFVLAQPINILQKECRSANIQITLVTSPSFSITDS